MLKAQGENQWKSSISLPEGEFPYRILVEGVKKQKKTFI